MKYTVELVSKITIEVDAETGADAAIDAQTQAGEQYEVQNVFNDKYNEVVPCADCMQDIDLDIDSYTFDVEDGDYYHDKCLSNE